MKSIANKTQTPLSVPLPRKTLHLGPGRTGQIASEAAEHPPLAKPVLAGEIELFDDGPAPIGGNRGRRQGRPSFHGHPANSVRSPRRRPLSDTRTRARRIVEESTGLTCGSARGGRLRWAPNGATHTGACDQGCWRARCASASRSP